MRVTVFEVINGRSLEYPDTADANGYLFLSLFSSSTDFRICSRGILEIMSKAVEISVENGIIFLRGKKESRTFSRRSTSRACM